ncbi:hypothetical protein BOTBODRAFT_121711, partial [Botryobasidium botryosum FD-172 SS1]
LVSYHIAADPDAMFNSLRSALRRYIGEVGALPPIWSPTQTSGYEICERDAPLTYHHLTPRARVPKCKRHPGSSLLNLVARLCRPCHFASHGYYTVELLLAREDVQKWKKRASKQRRGVRRGLLLNAHMLTPRAACS